MAADPSYSTFKFACEERPEMMSAYLEVLLKPETKSTTWDRIFALRYAVNKIPTNQKNAVRMLTIVMEALDSVLSQSNFRELIAILSALEILLKLSLDGQAWFQIVEAARKALDTLLPVVCAEFMRYAAIDDALVGDKLENGRKAWVTTVFMKGLQAMPKFEVEDVICCCEQLPCDCKAVAQKEHDRLHEETGPDSQGPLLLRFYFLLKRLRKRAQTEDDLKDKIEGVFQAMCQRMEDEYPLFLSTAAELQKQLVAKFGENAGLVQGAKFFCAVRVMQKTLQGSTKATWTSPNRTASG